MEGDVLWSHKPSLRVAPVRAPWAEPCIFTFPASENIQECPVLCLGSSCLSLKSDKGDGLVIPRLWKEPGAHVTREGFPFLFGFTKAQTSFDPVFSISQC